MAGLDPATQHAARQRGGKAWVVEAVWNESLARTDVRWLGGRVKPGHDGV
jgi:hypothetical protein